GEASFADAFQGGAALTPEAAMAEARQVEAPEPATVNSAVHPAVPPAAETYPPGLTEREVEGLRHVAQGLTRAQVAEQLVISAVTVSTHLRNIYDKLGVNSRTAAAKFAIEHDLV